MGAEVIWPLFWLWFSLMGGVALLAVCAAGVAWRLFFKREVRVRSVWRQAEAMTRGAARARARRGL